MMKKLVKRISIFLLIGFIVIQFFRIDKSVPEYDKEGDFITVLNPEKNIAEMLRNSCYDCHSYETKYPWYSEIAPISWMLSDHIEEGREHFNFSLWLGYNSKKQDHKLEECIDEIEEGAMPDPNYVKMHSGAELTEENKVALITYFENLRLNFGVVVE